MRHGVRMVAMLVAIISVSGCLGRDETADPLAAPISGIAESGIADDEARLLEGAQDTQDDTIETATVETAPDASSEDAAVEVADASSGGFLAFLRPAAAAVPDEAAPTPEVDEEQTPVESVAAAEEESPSEPEADATAEPATALVEAVEPTQEPAQTQRRGLFGGGLFARARAPEPAPTQTEQDAPDVTPSALRRAASSEPDIVAGSTLAFGQVGRVCDIRKRDMGTRLDRFPDRSAVYTLYDSAAGSIEPRAFYITGFSDGCARQVTAANAVFGTPSMHERLRYGLPADALPSSETDKAYKRLKSRICRVGRNKPCTEAGLAQLERNTVFVTLYRSFTGNQDWSNLLLHDGDLIASDIKQVR